jgi:hypothetical protein
MDRPKGRDPYVSGVLMPLTVAALSIAAVLLLVRTGPAAIILRIIGLIFYGTYVVILLRYARRRRGPSAE